MRDVYRKTLQTPLVEKAQLESYGRVGRVNSGSASLNGLGESELEFIASKDSFYMASNSESGWPYLQHRGGSKGFLKVLDDRRLAFADYSGNRQLITTGNLASSEKVSLFLMDYPARERLKLIGLARVFLPQDFLYHSAFETEKFGPDAERYFVIEVLGFDWNCPKYIVPRYTREEVNVVTRSLQDRIEALESELVDYRSARRD